MNVTSRLTIVVIFSAIAAFPPAGLLQADDDVVLVTPNLDDDDLDGIPDGKGTRTNGQNHDDDLTEIEIPFRFNESQLRITGPGSRLFRVVRITSNDGPKTTIYLEAVGTRSRESHATLTVGSNNESLSFSLDVRPFVLASSLDRAEEVFVVEVPKSKTFVKDLKRIFCEIDGAPKLTVLSVDEGDPTDVWIQDATEIGFFEGSTMKAALRGLREKHYTGPPSCNAKPLDDFFAINFLGPGRAVLSVGDPLPNRKWIDWFGNLEVTPALGTSFPYGRILTGRQGDLGMHDSVMQFLRDQGVQWPPVTLDTSFLMIGHVDEIINFVPSARGYSVLLASPNEGWNLLTNLSHKGHGKLTLLQGKESEICVDDILNNQAIRASNDAAAAVMLENEEILREELGLEDEDIIRVPVVFKKNGWSLWPNIVNGLVLDKHFICPRPFGPEVEGEDAIEAALRASLQEIGVTTHFVDVFDAYSSMAGECHCGTNSVREPILKRAKTKR